MDHLAAVLDHVIEGRLRAARLEDPTDQTLAWPAAAEFLDEPRAHCAHGAAGRCPAPRDVPAELLQFHDLVRSYARQCALGQHPARERMVALTRPLRTFGLGGSVGEVGAR